jgi:capsule polysaccharide modification protein KpsS
MLGAVFGLNPRLYDHINFWEASKYFITKKLFSRREEDLIDWPKEYVFVPFQVSRDSQIFYNSPNVKTMETLLKVTVQAIKSVNEKENRNIKVIIKEHPEDMSRNNYRELKQAYKHDDRVIFVKKFNVHKLIKHAVAVITINSTVGIEALAHHKRVITLGDALYNIEGITSTCDQVGLLDDVLLQSLQRPIDTSRIDKFLYYLRFDYQIEGTINYPSRATAKNVVDRMLLED